MTYDKDTRARLVETREKLAFALESAATAREVVEALDAHLDARGAPLATVPAPDGERASDAEDVAIDVIYSMCDGCYHAGAFGVVDQELATADPSELSIVVGLAWAAITAAVFANEPEKLPHRPKYMKQLRAHLERVDPARVEALLSGFEDVSGMRRNGWPRDEKESSETSEGDGRGEHTHCPVCDRPIYDGKHPDLPCVPGKQVGTM